jgi:Flp pilus assembly protein TadD
MAGLLIVDGKTSAVSAGTFAPQVAPAVYFTGDPNASCAACHRDIYERYKKTPMANASGLAADGFLPGGFTHAASGVEYRMEKEGGKVYLAFERKPPDLNLGIAVVGPGGASASGGTEKELKGWREMKYFLGSGKRGRTYLFEQEGYWFESPINWYAKKRVWDMAPNYLKAREVPLTLQIDPGCLRCHSSGAQPSLREARNRYAGAPFLQGGITCTSCHGDASAHLASQGRTAMLKLDQLLPVRRDSICLSCHLEGQEAVVREGKRLVDFHPGESIFDYAGYFVRKSQSGAGGTGAIVSDARATSQWEALLQSGCRRGVGEKITCTSCHDPHSTASAMTTEQRVEFYRGRCLACHDPDSAGQATHQTTHVDKPIERTRTGFAVTHHPENPDCTACHMPRAGASDIAHEQVTDHRIPRTPPLQARKTKQAMGDSTAGVLMEVGDGSSLVSESSGKDHARDLGLAYAMEAARGDAGAAERARTLLREAEELPGAAGDHELHAQLGFLEQIAGDKSSAALEYGLALAADADDSFATGNLALLKASDRQYGEAIALWERAFSNDPAQVRAGMNLAVVQCGLGSREAALGTLEKILEFSPDDGQARQLATEIRSGRHVCGGH